MIDILKKFEERYAYLKKKGMKVDGLALVDPKHKKHVINISKPFIFDNRKLPKRYEGIEIKSRIQGELPLEFIINKENPEWQKTELIWSPDRFEAFVDRCFDDIRVKLEDPLMTREEMLDALCFGNFEDHKVKCDNMIKEGKIPNFRNNNKAVAA